jgi:hypothetical protein
MLVNRAHTVTDPGLQLAVPAVTPGSSTGPMRMSDAGVDFALLISALFLQRFSLSFGNTVLSLDTVPVALIIVHQFVSGKLLIQYDRLLWFLVVVLAVTSALLLHFKITMLSSYFLFLVVYSLFTLIRPSTPARYQATLRAFQFLVGLLSFLAIWQFFGQYVVDGREIVGLFGIFPEFLFASLDSSGVTGVNTIIPITSGSSLIKSNAVFLTEPSTLSQIAALGILIEAVEFRRPRYLALMVLGLLFSYSGTGLITLLLFLPLAGLHKKAGLPVLLAVIVAIGLFATGVIDLSAFTSRADEFENNQTSGFQRFIAPFWLAAQHLDTAPLPALLFGEGPGTMKEFAAQFWYGAGAAGTWIKLIYEYGLVGSFLFACFLASCFRGSRCPGLVIAAIVFSFVFLGGLLLSTPFLVMMVVLCTLSGPEPRRDRIARADEYRCPFPAAATAD